MDSKLRKSVYDLSPRKPKNLHYYQMWGRLVYLRPHNELFNLNAIESVIMDMTLLEREYYGVSVWSPSDPA